MPAYLRAKYSAMMKTHRTFGLEIDPRTGRYLWEIWDSFENHDTLFVDARLGECQRCCAGMWSHQPRCMFCGCVRKGHNKAVNPTYPQIELADI